MTNDKRAKCVNKAKKMQEKIIAELSRSTTPVKIVEENGPVALIVSYRIECLTETTKRVECSFAGIVKHISNAANCHVIYVDEAHLENKAVTIQKITEYLKKKDIQAVFYLHAMENDSTNAIEMESKEYQTPSFIEKIIQYSFEYQLWKDVDKTEKVPINAFSSDFVVSCIDGECSGKGVALNISRAYADLNDVEKSFSLIDTLTKIVITLSNLDWTASKIEVYRLGQSKKHKPQDKVELYDNGEKIFEDKSFLSLCNFSERPERVRIHYIQDDSKKTETDSKAQGRLFLTNRLIENMFGREWVEKDEETPGLEGAPIVLYESKRDNYAVGMSKANKIENVYFSSTLYKELRKDADKYDFAVFNKYTDSMLYVDFETADYDDCGRVKGNDGNPAKKIMMPRYYKVLLGYVEEPLKRIREEEYNLICCEGVENSKTEEKKCFEKCYEKISGQPYYSLKSESELEEETKAELFQIQKERGFFSHCELLRIPKYRKKEKRIVKLWNKIRNLLLNIFINKAEYLLKTVWTSETDDKNNVARLNSNMMSLMGIAENDKILVKFGKEEASMRVLVNDELTDYEIGIPAPARKKLGMYTVHDIVCVHRDMIHIFFRHSEAQTITIFGTILTVCELTENVGLRIILSVFCVIISMYLVLNEERIKVK